MPVLVLAGTKVLVTPITHSKTLHEGLSQSFLVSVEGAGHNPAVQGQEVATEAVRRFLESM